MKDKWKCIVGKFKNGKDKKVSLEKNEKQKVTLEDKKPKEKVTMKERAKGLVKKIKENRMKTIVGTVTIVLFAVVAIIAGQVVKEQNRINGMSAENRRAMNYEQVQDGDEIVENTNGAVEFDAFFLRDLTGDGYAESIRGTSKEIGKEDTLYMELNVQTEGYLKNAKIEINGENFYLQTALPKDDELKDSYVGNNIKTIEFNDLSNGTQKLLTGIVRSGDYSYSSRKAEAIGNNINNYSKVNSVTLTGTYVNGVGEEKEISKTVKFNIDWYGTTIAKINTTSQSKNIEEAINEEGIISLDFTIYTQETENELILSKNQVEGEIPELNGYAPISVEYTGNNGTFNYDEETRIFTITRTAEANEEGKVTSIMQASNNYGIKVTYPIEAYYELGTETVTLKVPVKTYYEGYNNQNEEFTNPYKSNIANATIVTNYKRPVGAIVDFDVTVGKYISSPEKRYVISKQKPLKIYNGLSESETEDEYLVTWYGTTGSNGTGNMIMKETKDEETQVTDQFIKTNSTEESMEEVTSFTGIYFSNPENLLGEEGEIKVYDEDTGNLLVTFTKSNWSKYTSNNPYKYELPVKHIRVETSATNANENIYVYNVKTLDDEKITTKYTREQFNELQYIKSTLVGYIGETYITTDTHQANYEAPTSIADISISNNTLSTQSTEKNAQIIIQTQANDEYNQVNWQNGTFLVKMPDEILTTEINEVMISNSNVELTSYELIENENGTFIKINTQNNTPQTYIITIDVNLSPDPRIATTTKQIELYATNENGSDYYYNAQDIYDVNDNLNTEEMVNHTTTNINMISPNSLLTNEIASKFDDKGSIVISPEVADIKPTYAVVDQEEEKTAEIGVQIKNNYASTISEIEILGKIPFEGNTYVLSGGDLESNFTTKMKNTGIQIPAELQEIATVYYSDQETPDRDLAKAENNWKTAEQVENWDNIKTFLIDLGDYVMPTGKEFIFNYTIKIPNGLEFNQVSYSHHGVYFCLDTEQGKYRTQTEPNKIGFRIAEKYNLELTKYQKGKDKLIPGATYSVTEIITSNEEGEVAPSYLVEERGKTKTAVTNAQGILTITNLYAEKVYEIREIKSPDDYEINGNVIRFIGHVDEEGNLSIEKLEGEIKGQFEVIKEEGEDYKVTVQVEDEVKAKLKVIKKEQGTDTTIQGVRFKLTGYNLSENGRNLTTNSNGELTFSGLSVNQEYTLQEIKAEGYYLANPIKFKIVNNDGNYTLEKIQDETATGEIKEQTTIEEDSIPTISITIEDEKIPTYDLQLIKIKKTTESTVSDDELIAKAETELADTEVEYLEGAKFKLYKGTEEIGEYTTDSEGKITIPGLYQYEEEKGIDQTYTLKEILAPEGYAKVKDITFKVEEVDGSLVLKEINEEGEEVDSTRCTTEGNIIKLTIEDSPSFKLIKKDAETQNTLSNIKFAIYNVDDGSEQPATNSKGEIIGTKETINGKEYYTVTTDEYGEITADLTEGLYKAVEVEAPEQYDISNSTYYFGIGASRETQTTMSATQVMSIGGSNSDQIQSVTPTNDGGYIAGGYFRSSEIQVGDYTLTNNSSSTNYSDGMIIKYNETGEVEWATSVGGSNQEQIQSVASTSDGGLIAGGYFYSSSIQVGDYTLTNNSSSTSYSDGMIIKYSSTGEVEWARSVGGSRSDYIQSVAQTSDGYIVGGYFNSSSIQVGNYRLTNNSSSTSYYDGMIIKYNETGEVEWATSVGGSKQEQIQSVASTSDGGLIAGGYFSSSSIQVGNYTLTNDGGSDGMIIKYNETGEVEWATSVGGSNQEQIQSVASTSDGGLIAGGYFYSSSIQVGDYTLTNNSSSTSYSNGMIIKYNVGGKVEWATSVGGSSSASIKSVASASDGGVIAGGYFENSSIQVGDYTLTNSGIQDGMIIKYSSSGEVEYAKGIGGKTSDQITSVALTNDGGYIAGGLFSGNSIQVGDFILKFNGSFDGMIIKLKGEKELNNPITIQAQSTGGSYTDQITSVTPTNDGGYIAGGYFNSRSIQVGDYTLTNNGGSDGMIIKYSSTGEVEWARSVGGSSDDYIESVAQTSDGGVIAGGYFNSSSIQVGDYTLTNNSSFTSYSDGMIIKYSSTGEVEWAKSVGGSNSDKITSVAPTSDGGVIAGGYFQSSTIQVGDYTLTNSGGLYSDGMIIKYNVLGEVEWARSVGGDSKHDQINSVAQTSDGGVIAGGYFQSSTIQVGDYTLMNSGSSAGMIMKYNALGEVEWAKSVGGGLSDEIRSVAQTSDGEVIVGGYFTSSSIQVGDYILTNTYSTDGMIIKYNETGEVEWATSVGGKGSDYIQSVAQTSDGEVIAGGYFTSSSIQAGYYTLSNNSSSTSNYDGMLIKYNREGEVEWAKGIGGSSNDYINSVAQTTDGTIIAGGYFQSTTIETDGKTLSNAGGQDGMLLKIANQVGVPEVQELTVENTRKEFKITTDVKEINEIKGGEISGEDKNPYESVKYGETSQNEIKMTPDENYEIISITVNGEEYTFTAEEDGTYTMPPFENMTEDKHVEVTYALKTNKFTINKIDAKTQAPLQGATFKIQSTEEVEGEVYEQEVTTNSQGQAILQLPFGTYQITEIKAPEGYEQLKDHIDLEFTEESNNHEITIENNTIARVIVHHYLKTEEGEYTTTKVAEDDVIEKTDKETYTTSPKLDLEKYELEKDEEGNYVIPEKATGNFVSGETIEVTYYYEEKEIPLTVHHYIEGTTQPVPLKDGTEAEDVTDSGKEGTTYQTSEIEDSLLSDAYEIAEIPENAQGTYTGEEVIVTYYYKLAERPLTIVKTGEDGEALEGVKFEIINTETKETEEYTTNHQGKITTTLESGTYEIAETETKEGYVIPENATQTIEITKEKDSYELTIVNPKAQGTVITHYYIEGTEEKVPSNIEGQVVEDLTQTGKIGDIYITEEATNVSDRYELKQVVGEVQGTIDEEYKEIIYYYGLKEANLTLVKTNEQGEGLEGASFKIENKESGKVKYVTTGENGEITEKVEIGENVVTEEKSPEGYKLNKNPQTINVELNKENKITITNKKINYFVLNINKVDSETNEKIPGAKFTLSYTTQYGEQKTEQYETAEDGTITLNNLENEIVYTLKETGTPKGYLGDTEEKQFVVHYVDGKYEIELLQGNFKDTVIENNIIKVNVANTPSFKVVKQDENGLPIQGVKFTITDEQGQEVTDGFGNPVGEVEEINGEQLRVLTTNENGVISENLVPGKYVLTEVQTPSKYILPEENERIQTIEITSEGFEKTYVEQKDVIQVNFEQLQNIIDFDALEENIGNIEITADEKVVLVSGLLKDMTISGEYTATGEDINLQVIGGMENAINIITNPDGKVENVVLIKTDEGSASVGTNIFSLSNGDYITLGMYMGTIKIPEEDTVNNQEITLSTSENIATFMARYNNEGKIESIKDITYLRIDLNNYSYDIQIKDLGNKITFMYPYDDDQLTIPASETATGEEITVNNQAGMMVVNLNSDFKVIDAYSNYVDVKYEQEYVESLSTGEVIVGGYNDSGSVVFTEDETTSGERIELDNNGDGIIAKYDVNGKVEWAKKLGSQAEFGGYNKITEVSDGYLAIAYYNGGDLVIPAEETVYGEEIKFENPQGDDKQALIKYTTNGQVEWAVGVDPNIGFDADSIIKETQNGYSIFNTNNGIIVLYEKVHEEPIVKEQNVVTIQNELANGNVIVHHYKENTTESLSADQTITGKIDTNYETQPATDIPVDYELVAMPENATGTIKEGTIEVIYYYKLKDPIIETPEIIKESTTEKITSLDQAIDYNVTYTTKIDSYIGNATVTIVDTLPYEIDLDKSNIANGSYNNEEKTIIWTEEISNIDTFVNGAKEINITKEISLVYKDIDVAQTNIQNKVTGTIHLETSEKEETVEDTKEIPTEYTTQITVNKIWNDNEIQAGRRPESIIIVVKNGEQEVITKEMTTADLVEGTTNQWSTTIEGLQKYDENGNEIQYTVGEREKVSGDLKFYEVEENNVAVQDKQATIRNNFKTPDDEISITVRKIWNDNSNIKEKRPNSIKIQLFANGTLSKEQVVDRKMTEYTNNDVWTYTFTKLDKYDENGQEIVYTVDEEEVMENDLYYYGKEVGEVIDKAGETNVKEAEITNTMNKTPSTVVVKYVDKNTGKEITDEKTKEGIIGDPYDVTEDVKEIPGYTLVEEPAEKTGVYTSEPQEKIYYYAKNTKVTVKYLEQDETPNDIADNKVLAQEKTMLGYEGESYSTFAEDIEGYTLVETTNNTSGVMQREEIVVIYYYAPNTNVVVKYLEKDNTPEDNTDNKVLEPERTIEGYVGKEYKTIKEDIPGYTFIESTENTEGAMTKDPIEVIYYYAQNTKVIVKYLEKDDTPEDNTDNQVLAKEEVIEGYEGKEYETEQKTIDNYTFVESTNNTKGNMTKETIEVIYYYAQNTKAKVQHIDRETGKILKEETKNGKVGDIFETQAEDFEGYVLVGSPEEPNIVMDKTGEQVVKYYYAHVSAGVIEKHIDDITGELLYSEEHKGNEGDYYNIPSKTFEGYDLVTEDSEGNSKLPTNAEGNMTQNLIEVKYYYIKKAKVIVKYLEQDNTPEDLTDNLVLEDEETIEGHENDDYTTTAKDIKGYNLVETPENATGKMEITKNPDGTYNTEIIVVYYYKKQAGGVIENHIDIHTNKKLAVEEHEGNVGDEYNIPARGFEGYDLVAVDEEGNSMLPTNAKGQMTEEVIEVNYYYEKQAKVKVEYIDKETGNKLDEEEIQGHVGDSYETEEKQFEGYDLVEKPSNGKGEMEEEEIIVKYYYERKAEVEVKYLEKGTDYEVSPTETIEGHVGDKYETEQKEIPYYKFVEKTENYKGKMEKEKITVIYYYEKQLFNLSVDKWISNVNVNGISQGAQSITTKDQLYKVDIHRSKVETADIKITYKIRITNKGEIEGTAGEIVEVIPAGYSYNQEDNSIYWENKNGTLTTDALKDEMIQPGQYKEIEIVLRWIKGENNFGQKDNLVILSNLDNPAGYEDVNKEDNSSSSSMLLTIATGLDRNDRIVIIGIVQIVLAISIGLLFSYKKKEKNSK